MPIRCTPQLSTELGDKAAITDWFDVDPHVVEVRGRLSTHLRCSCAL